MDNTNDTAVIYPSGDYMTAAEVISWIACCKSLPLYSWLIYIFGWDKRWYFHDIFGISVDILASNTYAWPLNAEDLLKILSDRAEGKEGDLPNYAVGKARERVIEYLNRFGSLPSEKWAELRDNLAASIQQRDTGLPYLHRARGALRCALWHGVLDAAGQPAGKLQPRILIPSAFWLPGIEIDFKGQVSEELSSGFSDDNEIIHFERLAFDTAQVLHVWPVPEAIAEAVSPPIASPRHLPRAELEAWWTNFVETHQKNDTTPTRKEQYEAALAVFPDLPERRMEELRALPVTPAAWRRPGRRRG